MKKFERIVGVTGVANFGVVSNTGIVAPSPLSASIVRGAQPEFFAYKQLRFYGIKTVLNLRTHSEKKWVEEEGMISIEHPLDVFTNISVEEFNYVINIMKDPNNQPLFVHCRQGHDRTGVICASYRIAVDGWTLDEAEAEMQEYGFNDLWFILSRAVRQFYTGVQ